MISSGNPLIDLWTLDITFHDPYFFFGYAGYVEF
jgi:hypothetical protein